MRIKIFTIRNGGSDTITNADWLYVVNGSATVSSSYNIQLPSSAPVSTTVKLLYKATKTGVGTISIGGVTIPDEFHDKPFWVIMTYTSDGWVTVFLPSLSEAGSVPWESIASIGKITNDDVATSAAISRDKLANGTASRALINNASGVISESNVTATELAFLSGVTSAIQTQINNKLSTVTNANVEATAAIALSKLAAVTANRALKSDANGVIVPAGITSTELEYLAGVHTNVQTQFSDKVSKALLRGHIFIGNSLGSAVAMSVKDSGKILVGNGTDALPVSVSGDATLSSAGTLTIANEAITAAKLSDSNRYDIKYFFIDAFKNRGITYPIYVGNGIVKMVGFTTISYTETTNDETRTIRFTDVAGNPLTGASLSDGRLTISETAGNSNWSDVLGSVETSCIPSSFVPLKFTATANGVSDLTGYIFVVYERTEIDVT